MKINRENYESYFIDDLDGTLSEKELQELKAFLLVNDDLAEMLEDMDMVKLKVPEIDFPSKERLHQDLVHECPDYYAIAENAITEEDKLFLRYHLKDKQLQAKASEYKKLKLIPDQTLRYPSKLKLLRKKRIYSYIYIPVAALLCLFFGWRILLPKPAPNTYTIILDNQILNVVIEDINTIRNDLPHQEKDTIQYKPKPSETGAVSRKKRPIIEKIPVISTISLSDNKLYIEHTAIEAHLKTAPHPATFSPEMVLYGRAEEWKISALSSNSSDIISSIIHAGKGLAKRIKSREEKENGSNKLTFESVIW